MGMLQNLVIGLFMHVQLLILLTCVHSFCCEQSQADDELQYPPHCKYLHECADRMLASCSDLDCLKLEERRDTEILAKS